MSQLSATQHSIVRGTLKTFSSIPSVSGLSTSGPEVIDSAIRRLTLSFSSVSFTLTDNGTNGSGSLKILDFGEGLVLVLGAQCNLTYAYGSVTDANLISALGTTAANADGDLADSNEANIVPSTATASSSGVATFNAGSTAVAFLQGQATAADLYLNIATSTDPSTNNTILVSGTIDILYTFIGDR